MTAKPPRSGGTTGKRRATEFARGAGVPVDADLDERDQATLRLARAIEEETRQRQRENRDRASIARGLYPVGAIPPGVPLPKWGRGTRNDRTAPGDCPDERGYVKVPIDETAFVPATVIVKEHMPAQVGTSHKHLTTILKNHPEIRRWRWRKNRLSIHLADWHGFLKRHETEKGPVGDDDDWPQLREEERAELTLAIRRQKTAG